MLDRTPDALANRVRRTLDVEVASVAHVDADGEFVMSGHAGATSTAYRSLRIRPGAGLGGLVGVSGDPVRLRDYHRSRRITDDYHAQVADEGLRAMACVPVRGPSGTTVLLFVGNREADTVDDRRLGRLEGIASTLEDDLPELTASGSGERAARADERRRLASRLHDSVAQALFAIATVAETGAERAAGSADALRRIAALARTGRADLRQTFADLSGDNRPDARAAIVTAADDDPSLDGIDVHWLVHGERADLPPSATELAVDVVREGIRNAVRHTDSTDVLATLRTDPTRLAVCVQVPAAEPVTIRPRRGSGLHLLRVRAEHLGGRLAVSVHRDGPETIVVTELEVPLRQAVT